LQQNKYTAKMSNYRRRRADQQKSAGAPTNCRRRRPAQGSSLELIQARIEEQKKKREEHQLDTCSNPIE